MKKPARTEALRVRLTAAEKEKIAAAADAAGMTPSAWVRFVMLRKAPRTHA